MILIAKPRKFNTTKISGYTVYDIRHMVKDHSDNERGNPPPPHGFQLAARVLLYASSHTHNNKYHCLCYTNCSTRLMGP